MNQREARFAERVFLGVVGAPLALVGAGGWWLSSES